MLCKQLSGSQSGNTNVKIKHPTHLNDIYERNITCTAVALLIKRTPATQINVTLALTV